MPTPSLWRRRTRRGLRPERLNLKPSKAAGADWGQVSARIAGDVRFETFEKEMVDDPKRKGTWVYILASGYLT